MSAQKPNACILNTLNHNLRANEYTNLHKNNALSAIEWASARRILLKCTW